MAEALLDWQGAADYLNTTVRWVRYARSQGLLPFIKVGKHVRFHPEDLRRFVDANRHEPEPVHPLLKGRRSA